MEPWFWAIVFCLLMMVAVVLEILTPTMGGFTLLAVGLAGVSVYTGFVQSQELGYVMLVLNCLLLPGTFWLGLRWMRHSPLMNRRELSAGTQSSPDAPPLTPLVGRQGRALTPLRPAGTVMLGAQRVDVVTEGKFVDRDTMVKVIRVEGNRVLVEPLPKS